MMIHFMINMLFHNCQGFLKLCCKKRQLEEICGAKTGFFEALARQKISKKIKEIRSRYPTFCLK
jgi:hypothetical protein